MSRTQLYTVHLTDLVSYRVTVAADSVEEAASVAKTMLWEETADLPADVALLSRETDTQVQPADVPVRQFRVRSTYRMDFALTVPAANAEEAERHAKRLYAAHSGPFEFDLDGDRVASFVAEEMAA